MGSEDDIFFKNPEKKESEPEYYDPPTGPIFNINFGGFWAFLFILALLAIGFWLWTKYGSATLQKEPIQKTPTQTEKTK